MNWWLIGVGGTLALMSCIFTGLVIWANWDLLFGHKTAPKNSSR
ncbi:hypothetical protein [Lonepinella sp. BR2882]